VKATNTPLKPNAWSRAFQCAVWAGIAANLVFAIPGILYPNLVLSWANVNPAADPVWPAFSCNLLLLLSMFYIPAALNPFRYKTIAWMTVGARFAGVIFFGFVWPGFPVFAGLDFFFGTIELFLLVVAFSPRGSAWSLRARWGFAAVVTAVVTWIGMLAYYKLARPLPQVLRDASAEERFKYGSIGAEPNEGFPFYVWDVLPEVFADLLPTPTRNIDAPVGYEAFGAIVEPGRPAPIGFSIKTEGFPRVAINCAACHTASYRETAEAERAIIPTGPSSTFDSLAYLRFLIACGDDPRFEYSTLMKAMLARGYTFSAIDRLLYRFVIIPLTRQGLVALKHRYAWTYEFNRPAWGPGRIDPFNPVKFQMLGLEDDESIGNSDMMPIWEMRNRVGHDLHFGPISTDVEEVVMMGTLGDGASNKTLPHEHMQRIRDFIMHQPAPKNPRLPDASATEAIERGKEIFMNSCADCHGPNGSRTGQRVELAEIGTDPNRSYMWTLEAKERYETYSDGYPWDFNAFTYKPGYVATPLTGLWLRAPYLHNGSVPTLRDLLKPSSAPRPEDARPASFYRGYDVLDPINGGFISTADSPASRYGVVYDTSLPGNSNAGHEGPGFGTDLSAEDREALLEYLKTL